MSVLPKSGLVFFAGVVLAGCSTASPLPTSEAPNATPLATALPTPTSEPTAEPTPDPTSEVTHEPTPGPNLVLVGGHPQLGSVYVSAPDTGWDTQDGIYSRTEADTGMLVFTDELWIYADPCDWSTTTPDTPARNATEIIAALAGQASRDASVPADITVGEYSGQAITLHVPADIRVERIHEDNNLFPDCDDERFATLTTGVDGVPLSEPERYAQDAGQVDEFWAVDVDGVPVVFDLAYWASAPQDVIDDLRAMAASATFGE